MYSVTKYGAGFVGKKGGDIKLLTSNREEALKWTGDNKKEGVLAVVRGYGQEELSLGMRYMNSILVNHVIGFDGKYTKGYLYQLAQECHAEPHISHSTTFYNPLRVIS